jgi:hypothetical protein
MNLTPGKHKSNDMFMVMAGFSLTNFFRTWLTPPEKFFTQR